MKKTFSIIAILGATAACTNDPELNKTYWGAGIGTAAGAVTGLLAGDDADERLRYALVGAGLGATAGAGVGYYMDQQEQEFRNTLQAVNDDYSRQIEGYQNQIRVDREANDILINMPAAVTFDYDSAALKTSFYRPLDSISSILQKYSQTNIVITGHTDSDGSMEYNQSLSERRAASVASYLSRNGVSQGRITTRGAGESLPVANNSTETGKAQNRRVEMRIVPNQAIQQQYSRQQQPQVTYQQPQAGQPQYIVRQY